MQTEKVFWFFFSKKNGLPSFLCQRPVGSAKCAQGSGFLYPTVPRLSNAPLALDRVPVAAAAGGRPALAAIAARTRRRAEYRFDPAG